MLSLEEIRPYYPEKLQQYDRFILREYMQYKILEIIFDSPFASKLSFLGGTCLRIVHGNKRFSEDLDFDNFNLSMKDFKEITAIVKKDLEYLGYDVEMRNVEKGAYHCYIRFPGILYAEGLSNHQEEKILIQLDTEPHHYNYQAEQAMLNKFDVFTQINTTPLNILLAQKFYAVINRKRNKGRDFFDIVFLLALGAKTDYEYLSAKLEIETPDALQQKVLDKCAQLDMKEMAADVKAFLFEPKDEKKVLFFPEYLKQIKL